MSVVTDRETTLASSSSVEENVPEIRSLTLHISHATNLRHVASHDGGQLVGDPYAIVYCGTHEVHRTNFKYQTLDPVFEESVQLDEEHWSDLDPESRGEGRGGGITIELYDHHERFQAPTMLRQMHASGSSNHHSKTGAFLGSVRLTGDELRDMVTPLAAGGRKVVQGPPSEAQESVTGEHLKKQQQQQQQQQCRRQNVFEDADRFLEFPLQFPRNQSMEAAVARVRRPFMDSAHHDDLPLPPFLTAGRGGAQNTSAGGVMPPAPPVNGALGQLFLAVTVPEAVLAANALASGIGAIDEEEEAAIRSVGSMAAAWQSTRLVVHVWGARDLNRDYGESVHVDVFLKKKMGSSSSSAAGGSGGKREKLSSQPQAHQAPLNQPSTMHRLIGSTQAVYSFGENRDMAFDAAFAVEGWNKERLTNPTLLLVAHAVTSKSDEDKALQVVSAFESGNENAVDPPLNDEPLNGFARNAKTVVGCVELDISSWAALQQQPLDSTHPESWIRLEPLDPSVISSGASGGNVGGGGATRSIRFLQMARKGSQVKPFETVEQKKMLGTMKKGASPSWPRGYIHVSLTMVELPSSMRDETILSLAAKDDIRRSHEQTLSVLHKVALKQQQKATKERINLAGLKRKAKHRHKSGIISTEAIGDEGVSSTLFMAPTPEQDSEPQALKTVRQINAYFEKQQADPTLLVSTTLKHSVLSSRSQHHSRRLLSRSTSKSKLHQSGSVRILSPVSAEKQSSDSVLALSAGTYLRRSSSLADDNSPRKANKDLKSMASEGKSNSDPLTTLPRDSGAESHEARANIQTNAFSGSSDTNFASLLTVSTEDPPHHWRSVIIERYNMPMLGGKIGGLPLMVKQFISSAEAESGRVYAAAEVNMSLQALWGSFDIGMPRTAKTTQPLRRGAHNELHEDTALESDGEYPKNCGDVVEDINLSACNKEASSDGVQTQDDGSVAHDDEGSNADFSSSDDDPSSSEYDSDDSLHSDESLPDLEQGRWGKETKDDETNTQEYKACCGVRKVVARKPTVPKSKSFNSYYRTLCLLLAASGLVSSIGAWPMLILGFEGSDGAGSDGNEDDEVTALQSGTLSFPAFVRVLLKASLLGGTAPDEDGVMSVPALFIALQLLVVILATIMEARVAYHLIWWIDPGERRSSDRAVVESVDTADRPLDLAPFTVLVYGLPISFPSIENGPQLLIGLLERSVLEVMHEEQVKRGTQSAHSAARENADRGSDAEGDSDVELSGGISTNSSNLKVVHVAPVVDLELLFQKQRKLQRTFEQMQQTILRTSFKVATNESTASRLDDSTDIFYGTTNEEQKSCVDSAKDAEYTQLAQTKLIDNIGVSVQRLRELEHHYLDVDEDSHSESVDGAGCAFVTFASAEAADACLVALSKRWRRRRVHAKRRAGIFLTANAKSRQETSQETTAGEVGSEVDNTLEETRLGRIQSIWMRYFRAPHQPALRSDVGDTRPQRNNETSSIERKEGHLGGDIQTMEGLANSWSLRAVPACAVCDIHWQNLAVCNKQSRGTDRSTKFSFGKSISGGHPTSKMAFASTTWASWRQSIAVAACALAMSAVLAVHWAILNVIAIRKRDSISNISSIGNTMLTVLSTVITLCFDGLIARCANQLVSRHCLRHYRHTINEAFSLVLVATTSTVSHTMVIFLAYAEKSSTLWIKPNDLATQFLLNEVASAFWPLVDLTVLLMRRKVLLALPSKKELMITGDNKKSTVSSLEVAERKTTNPLKQVFEFCRSLLRSTAGLICCWKGSRPTSGRLLKMWVRSRRPPSFSIHSVSFLVSSFATAVCLSSICPFILVAIFPVHTLFAALAGAVLSDHIWHVPRQHLGVLWGTIYTQAVALGLGGGGIGCMVGSCLVPLAGSFGCFLSVYYGCSVGAKPSYERSGTSGLPALLGGGFHCASIDDGDLDGTLTYAQVIKLTREMFAGKSFLGPTLVVLLVMRVLFGAISRRRRAAFDVRRWSGSSNSNAKPKTTAVTIPCTSISSLPSNGNAEVLTYHSPLPWALLERWEQPVKQESRQATVSDFLSIATFCNGHADDWTRCDPNGDGVLSRADIANLVVEALAVRSPWPSAMVTQFRARHENIALEKYRRVMLDGCESRSAKIKKLPSQEAKKFQTNVEARARRKAKEEAEATPFPPIELTNVDTMVNLVFERLDPTRRGYVLSSFLQQQMYHASAVGIEEAHSQLHQSSEIAPAYDPGHLSHLLLRIALNLGRDSQGSQYADGGCTYEGERGTLSGESKASIRSTLVIDDVDKPSDESIEGDDDDDDEFWVRTQQNESPTTQGPDLGGITSMAELASLGGHDNVPLGYAYNGPRKMPNESFLESMNQMLRETPTAVDRVVQSNLSAIDASNITFDPTQTLNFADATFVLEDSLDQTATFDSKPTILNAHATRFLWLDGLRAALNGIRRSDATSAIETFQTEILRSRRCLENSPTEMDKESTVSPADKLQTSISWMEGAVREILEAPQQLLVDLSRSSYGFRSVGSIRNVVPHEIRRAAERAREQAKAGEDVEATAVATAVEGDGIEVGGGGGGGYNTELFESAVKASVDLLMHSGVGSDGRRVQDDLKSDDDQHPWLTLHVSVRVDLPPPSSHSSGGDKVRKQQDESNMLAVPLPTTPLESETAPSSDPPIAPTQAFDMSDLRARGRGRCVAAKVFSQWAAHHAVSPKRRSKCKNSTAGAAVGVLRGQHADKRICMVHAGTWALAQALRKPLVAAITEAVRPDDGPVVRLLRERGLQQRRVEGASLGVATSVEKRKKGGSSRTLDLLFTRPFRVRVVFSGAKEGGALASLLATDVVVREALRDILGCHGLNSVEDKGADNIPEVHLVTVASPLPGDEGLALALATAVPQHVTIHVRDDPATATAESLGSTNPGESSDVKHFESQFMRRIVLDGPEDEEDTLSMRQRHARRFGFSIPGDIPSISSSVPAFPNYSLEDHLQRLEKLVPGILVQAEAFTANDLTGGGSLAPINITAPISLLSLTESRKDARFQFLQCLPPTIRVLSEVPIRDGIVQDSGIERIETSPPPPPPPLPSTLVDKIDTMSTEPRARFFRYCRERATDRFDVNAPMIARCYRLGFSHGERNSLHQPQPQTISSEKSGALEEKQVIDFEEFHQSPLEVVARPRKYGLPYFEQIPPADPSPSSSSPSIEAAVVVRVVEMQILCARDLILDRSIGEPDLFVEVCYQDEAATTHLFAGGVPLPPRDVHDTLLFRCSEVPEKNMITMNIYDWDNGRDSKRHQGAFHAGSVTIDLQSLTPAPIPTTFLFDVSQSGAYKSSPDFYFGQIAMRICTKIDG